MKVVFLAPYPTMYFHNKLPLRRKIISHPATWIENLSKALVKFTDIDLHIITLNRDVLKDAIIFENRITYHYLKSIRYPYRVLSFFQYDRYLLHKKIKEVKPDIIHAHGTEEGYSYCAITSGFPSIISMQGIVTEVLKSIDNRFNIVSFLWYITHFFEKWTVKNGKYFIVRTNLDRNFIEKYSKTPVLFDIWEIMSDVFFEVRRNRNKITNKILFVGTIIPSRGIDTLLNAFLVIYKEFPDIRLKLIGQGDKRYIEKIKKQYTELIHNNTIEFCGFKSSDEIAKEMEDALCLINPSYMENSSNSICEAQVAGVPIVASNVGGTPSLIIHNETGLLFEVKNPKDLVEKILYLIKNPDEQHRISENAKRLARERHNSKTIVEKIYSAYNYILKNK